MLGLHLHGGGGISAPVVLTRVTDTLLASATWTSPAQFWHADGTANAVQARCWAGGGGGTAGVGGGGGGAFAEGKVAGLSPSTGYTVTVAGVASGSVDGGNSSFESNVIAIGGQSGASGGLGGTAAASTGDTKFSGGNGATGTGNVSGGGGAGDAGNASGASGGDHTGGFSGANANGRQLGAGGGSSAAASRAGARGEVRVIYDVVATAGFPRCRGRTAGRGESGSLVVTMPSDIAAGDRLLLIVTGDGTTTNLTVSGWTKMFQLSHSGGTHVFAAFQKLAAGGDTATISGTSTRLNWECWRFENAGEIEATVVQDTNTNADPPNHNYSLGSAKCLWIAAAAWDANAEFVLDGFPSGFGSFVWTGARNATGVVLGACEIFEEAAGKNPGTFTSNSEQYFAATFCVPPPHAALQLVLDTFFGNGTWTSPAHAGAALVRGWGGGAGNTPDVNSGGGGAYAQLNSFVYAASTGYTVTVGAGGNGNGGDTTFNTSSLVAKGAVGATGGTAAASTGDVKFSGADGVVATGNQNGGASAGSTSNASGITPGAPDGGPGGGAAANGFLPGGGAGGHATAQRDGSRGELRVEYLTEAPAGFARFRAYSYGRDTAAGTSRSITVPDGVEPGDLLLCLAAVDASATGTVSMAGWTELFEVADSANQVNLACYYKTATGGGSDSGTLATTNSRFTSHITLRIANGGTPTAATEGGTTVSSPDPPSHDTGVSDKYLWIAVAAMDNGTPSQNFISAVSTGFGNVLTIGSATNGAPVLALCMRLEETPDLDPSGWTTQSEQHAEATIAIPYAA